MRSLTFLAVCLSLLSLPAAGTAAGAHAPAGSGYFDMVVDEARGLVYASDSVDRIQVHDMQTLQILQYIAVGSGARGIAISPDGQQLAVAVQNKGEVALVDLDALRVTDRIRLSVPGGFDNAPYDVIYGRPGRLYVASDPEFGEDHLHIIDTVAGAEIGQSAELIDEEPRLAMTADGNTLFVAESASGVRALSRFDSSTDDLARVARISGGDLNLQTIAASGDGSRVFTSGGQIWSGDLQTLVGEFSPAGDEIEYVEQTQRLVISAEQGVSIIDAQSGQPVIEFAVNNPGVARVAAASQKLYVSTPAGLKLYSADAVLANTYIPAALKPAGPHGIYGTVAAAGSPVKFLPLELRFFNGSSWTTRATTRTDFVGAFAFPKLPGLAAGQAYLVRFLNEADPRFLSAWYTRQLESYAAGSNVHIGDFDIQNVRLTAPQPGAAVPMPATFTWEVRPASPTDRYELFLYDAQDGDPSFSADVGFLGLFQLNRLPVGFQKGLPYSWDITVRAPDGGSGTSYHTNQVTFADPLPAAALVSP